MKKIEFKDSIEKVTFRKPFPIIIVMALTLLICISLNNFKFDEELFPSVRKLALFNVKKIESEIYELYEAEDKEFNMKIQEIESLIKNTNWEISLRKTIAREKRIIEFEREITILSNKLKKDAHYYEKIKELDKKLAEITNFQSQLKKSLPNYYNVRPK